MIRAAFALALTLSACAPAPVSAPQTADPVSFGPADSYRRFSGRPAMPSRSNGEILEDFVDLTFRLENGGTLQYLTRFEGPITLRAVGLPGVAQRDLQALLSRLRREAGIDIALTQSANARITIQGLPSRTLRGAVSDAACFLAPNISDWQQYTRTRGTSELAWSGINQRERAAIFVPSDVAPQEIRDCLHEELAQALGPLNDLYRLNDSTFNDDDIHRVLTPFDMVILRTTYDDALRSGMTVQNVMGQLPAILARINPEGQRPKPSRNLAPQAWRTSITTALSGAFSNDRRRSAATQAMRQSQGLGDVREGVSAYTFGRLYLNKSPADAEAALRRADALFARDPRMAIHRAHVAMQLAAFPLQRGDAAGVRALVEPAMKTAKTHQNAALLTMLGLLRAEALRIEGRDNEASAQRVDSMTWARYGFGSEQAAQAVAADIARMSPLN